MNHKPKSSASTRKGLLAILWRMALCALALLCLLTATSVAGQQSTARVLDGAGTVESPLRIEVTGQVGLTGMLDSLLPFRGLPAVQIVYKDLAFPIPGMNEYFIGRPWLAFAFVALSVIAMFWACLSLTLAIVGKKLVLTDRA